MKNLKELCKECGGVCCNRPNKDFGHNHNGYLMLHQHEKDNYPTDVIIEAPDNFYWIKRADGGGCYFFDREKKECKIYDIRPIACRLFNCTKLIEDCFFFQDHPEVKELLLFEDYKLQPRNKLVEKTS